MGRDISLTGRSPIQSKMREASLLAGALDDAAEFEPAKRTFFTASGS